MTHIDVHKLLSETRNRSDKIYWNYVKSQRTLDGKIFIKNFGITTMLIIYFKFQIYY